MVILRRFFFIFIIFLALPFTGCQSSVPTNRSKLEDSPQNRKILAERYFELVPIRQMFKDIGNELATRMPDNTNEQFLAFWNTFLTEERVREMEAVGRESMAKHMTTSELQAFIEFMEKPEGQSAMGKTKYYMADMMPLIQKQSMMAIQEFQANTK
jgi:hypothetical protein